MVVVIVILWQLDLQLSMQSVPIITIAMSLNPALGRCTHTTLFDKVCQWLARVRWFSSDTPVTATNKTYLHDITEIMLKVVFNTITLPLSHWEICFQYEISNTIFLNVCLFGLLCFMLFLLIILLFIFIDMFPNFSSFYIKIHFYYILGIEQPK